MADKLKRVQQLIQKNLSEIIVYGLKSDLCSFASINDVEMTKDYSYCCVYVSHVEESKCDILVSYLNTNAKKIRSLLAKTLDIYKIPELKFFRDESFERGQKIDALIEKALNTKPKTLKDLDDEKSS